MELGKLDLGLAGMVGQNVVLQLRRGCELAIVDMMPDGCPFPRVLQPAKDAPPEVAHGETLPGVLKAITDTEVVFEYMLAGPEGKGDGVRRTAVVNRQAVLAVTSVARPVVQLVQ